MGDCGRGRTPCLNQPTGPNPRVRAAYAEWRELTDHALTVHNQMDRARGYADSYPEQVSLPGWSGTGWPGKSCEFDTWSDDRECFPLEWLWTYPECVLAAQKKQGEWQQTREAEEQERAERETLARLKSKYEGEAE